MTAKEVLDDALRRHASRLTTREKKCGRKIPYQSLEAAARALQAAETRSQTKMNIYRCEFCDCFHIGHEPAIHIEHKQRKWWGSRKP